MIFGWLKQRRRRKRQHQPFPPAWEEILSSRVWFDRVLEDYQRRRLRAWMQVFIPEKNWEGCGGQEMTEEIKIIVAAQAGVLMLGRDENYFDHVQSILVYPSAYRAPGEERANMIVTEGGSPRMGEAWWRGPVILSWKHARQGGMLRSPGDNLVLHEFAHQLDMLNGSLIDGTPPMESQAQLDRWVEVMTPAYEKLVRDCRSRHGHPVLSCYGATNVAEFFAVATESFFTDAVDFRIHLPDVYAAMSEFYGQDPAEWPRISS